MCIYSALQHEAQSDLFQSLPSVLGLQLPNLDPFPPDDSQPNKSNLHESATASPSDMANSCKSIVFRVTGLPLDRPGSRIKDLAHANSMNTQHKCALGDLSVPVETYANGLAREFHPRPQIQVSDHLF